MHYPSDLSDSQWQVIQRVQNDHRKRHYPVREVWNAIFYLLNTGCQWRMLPNNFPPWPLVYYHFKRWKNYGLIEEVHHQLYAQCRRLHRKKPQATVAILDSQSVKTTSVGGEHRGFDMGKRIKGRKRHLAVDSLGLIQTLIVHSASDQDRTSGRWVVSALMKENGSVRNIYADAGYTGKLEDFAASFPGCEMTIVKRTDKSFKVLPKRWIVERTFAWIIAQRRNAKDYERLVDSSRAMVLLALIKVMLKKLFR